MTTQEHSPFYRLCSGEEDAAETVMHQSATEGTGCLPNRICKQKSMAGDWSLRGARTHDVDSHPACAGR